MLHLLWVFCFFFLVFVHCTRVVRNFTLFFTQTMIFERDFHSECDPSVSIVIPCTRRFIWMFYYLLVFICFPFKIISLENSWKTQHIINIDIWGKDQKYGHRVLSSRVLLLFFNSFCYFYVQNPFCSFKRKLSADRLFCPNYSLAHSLCYSVSSSLSLFSSLY